MQNFYTPPGRLGPDHITLTGDEYVHATRSCRVRVGEDIGVTDGAGQRVIARITHIDRAELQADIREDVSGHGEPPCALTIGLAAIKAARFEAAVEKCTELGARRIVPLIAERCEPHSERRLNHDRLTRIALSAAKQAGRSFIPEIEEPCPVASFLESADMAVVVASQRGGRSLGEVLAAVPATEPRAVLIGPEGDFSDGEYDLFGEYGLQLGSMGGLVLRAETAAIAAVMTAVSGNW